MKYFLFALFLNFLTITLSFAQNTAPNATLDVFASKTAIERGETIDIAIRQNIRDQWHTYWFNAGDSGEPLYINWDLPDGVTVSDLNYPTPSRIAYDPLVNFGFEGAPIYTQQLTLSPSYQGDNIILTGEATWLVCQEICIPEGDMIALTIPVDYGEPAHEDIFETAEVMSPKKVDWPTRLTKTGNEMSLTVVAPKHLHNQMTDVEIYPYDWGIIQTTAPITSDIRDDRVIFTAPSTQRDFNEVTHKNFVIKTSSGMAYEVDASAVIAEPLNQVSEYSLFSVIIFAFIGGLILNLMPCVFPVLSMKALSLVQLSAKERLHAKISGIAYTVGVVMSFVIIAAILISLKGAGESIGWGFQLQNPYVVTGLATLLFFIGLNLFGLFEVHNRFANIGAGLTGGTNVRASFFTGVLAALVATPCTAPFMATAIGYALTQSAFISLVVFSILGLGLAFPYLLLTFWPKFQSVLPKPGAWMDTFKQALAWPMFVSAIWLIWVLVQQAGPLAVIYILGLFLSVFFVMWLKTKAIKKPVFLAVIAGLIMLFSAYSSILHPKKDMTYVPFNQTELDRVLQDNPQQPVFVNMTAAWCITCLVNERTSLSQSEVKAKFIEEDVLYMKGDWTNRDANITQFLEEYGRNGVPLYVYYGEADMTGKRPEPVILPQILTPDIVLDIF